MPEIVHSVPVLLVWALVGYLFGSIPFGLVITRALGLRPDVEVDAYQAELLPGDMVIICSDGLHGLVSDEEILAYVQRLRPADSVANLVQLANDRGGPDNISLVVARVRDIERDESDTARGIPILTDAMTETARTEIPTSQVTTAQMAAPSPQAPPSMSEMVTTPNLPVQSAAPYAAAPHPDQHPQQMLARPAQPRQLAQRNAQGSKSGGMTLLIVLVFLLVLGVAIALGLAYLLNVPLWPGSGS